MVTELPNTERSNTRISNPMQNESLALDLPTNHSVSKAFVASSLPEQKIEGPGWRSEAFITVHHIAAFGCWSSERIRAISAVGLLMAARISGR